MENLGDRITVLLNKSGIKVKKAIVLGKFLHIDTFQNQEMNIRNVLVKMGVKEVRVLPPGRDGKHLDGSSFHRIVGRF